MLRQSKEKISVRSIAKHLGLSPATVSLALNGSRPTSFVSQATRKQVWDAAKEMGYPMDRLRSTRTPLERVAVIMPGGPNPVYSETALAVCHTLNRNRVQVLTHVTLSDSEANNAIKELLRRQEIDAAVFIGSRTILPDVSIPTVFVGEVPEDSNVWQVRPDNEGGGRSVGEYLWSLGHRSIAVMLNKRFSLAADRRLQGLRAYWEEQGESFQDRWVVHVDPITSSQSEFRDSVTRFITEDRKSPNPVTAIFCFNDWGAAFLLKELRGQGIRVPEDMSVIGFDDSIYAELLDPPLTTVKHPFATLGELSAQMLLEQADKPSDAPRSVVARCQLIIRKSCAPPRS